MKRVALGLACLLLPAVASAHRGPSAEVAALDAELRARPGDVDLLLRRASVHRRRGDFPKAQRDLEAARARSPGRREIFLERGLLRAAEGQRVLAEKELDAFLASGPPSAEALAARAVLREATGRLVPARDDYEAALGLRPDPELYLARGRIDEALGELDRAALGYEAGLRKLGGAVVVRLALVRLERGRRRHERAMALVDEAIASAPLKADWLLLRAEICAESGREAEAAKDREAALREIEAAMLRKPTDLRRLSRARAYLALGRADEALRDAEAVVATSPGLAEARELRARARAAAGAGRAEP